MIPLGLALSGVVSGLSDLLVHFVLSGVGLLVDFFLGVLGSVLDGRASSDSSSSHCSSDGLGSILDAVPHGLTGISHLLNAVVDSRTCLLEDLEVVSLLEFESEGESDQCEEDETLHKIVRRYIKV